MSDVFVRPIAFGSKLTLRVGCVLIVDGAHRTLTDPGYFRSRQELEQALRAAAGIGLADIDTVFFTHLHFDHYADLGFADVGQVAISAAELDYLQGALAHRGDAEAFGRFIEDTYEYVAPVFLREFVRLAGDARYDFAKVSFADQIRLVRPGDRISENLEVVDLPGHSPGHIGLACNSQWGRTLIAGDAVLSLEEAMQPEAARYQLIYFDREALVETRRACMAYDAIIPGHGPWFSPATASQLAAPEEKVYG